MKLRIAVYARVSTNGQNHSGQLHELREYVRRRWPKAQVNQYRDIASGTRCSRKELDALMAEIRKGRVDVLVCYKLDRIGRSLQHLATLFEEFHTHGTALVVPSQGIDTIGDNPVAKMQRGMLAVFAEFERSIIVDRVKSGLAAARAHGTKSGKPFGRPRTLDKHAVAVAQLQAKGTSGRAIAEKLGIPAGSVFALMKRGKDQLAPSEIKSLRQDSVRGLAELDRRSAQRKAHKS